MNLSNALIEHKRINTTLAKAKALRRFIEPIITKSKTNTTHSRRIAFKYLNNKYAVTELFDVIGPKVADRSGGYTRIIRLGYRQGDAAAMAMIELVDFNELMLAAKAEAASKSGRRRRRRGGKKSAATAAVKKQEEE